MKFFTLIITVIFTSIFFNGCKLDTTDQFDVKVEDTLKSAKWYSIDNVSEKYTITEFSDSKVTESYYEDSSFSSLLYTKEYGISYKDNNSITLIDEYGEHSCKFTECDDDNWMIITCEADIPKLKGWSTRSAAVNHLPRQK
jgi:hypothetical protein